MSDLRSDLERVNRSFVPPRDSFERFLDLRRRRQVRRRVGTVLLALVIATSGLWVGFAGLRPHPTVRPATSSSVVPLQAIVKSTLALDSGGRAIASGDGAAWVSVYDRLVRINASTDETLTTSLNQGPYSLAVIGDSVWAAGYSKGEGSYLKRLDPATGSVVATVPFPGSAFSLDFSLLAGDDSSVWVGVSEPTGLHLVKIDPQTNSRVSEVSVGEPPKGAERQITDLVSGGGSIWALVRDLSLGREQVLDSYILQVDPASTRVVNTIEAPHASAILFVQGTVWASVGNFGSLRIDASSGATKKVSVPGNFSYPMGADDAGIWFVHLEEGGRASLARLNFQTEQVDVSAALPVEEPDRWPLDASIDLQTGTAWVLDADGSVIQVDLHS